LGKRTPTRAVLTLDSRLVLLEAIALTKRSKYAFAKAAEITPQALNRYLSPTGSQMTAAKLGRALVANGIAFKLALGFAAAAASTGQVKPAMALERTEAPVSVRSRKHAHSAKRAPETDAGAVKTNRRQQASEAVATLG
jgi:hypothetical protein